MITNKDITENFELRGDQLFRKDGQYPITGERVAIYKNGLQYNSATQAVRDVLSRLGKCNAKKCENGRVWTGSGFTPCPACSRDDEQKTKPRKKRTTKKKEQ